MVIGLFVLPPFSATSDVDNDVGVVSDAGGDDGNDDDGDGTADDDSDGGDDADIVVDDSDDDGGAPGTESPRPLNSHLLIT